MDQEKWIQQKQFPVLQDLPEVFSSDHLDLSLMGQPDTAVLSQEAHSKGPELINITYAVLHSFGIQIDNKKMSNGNPKHADSNFVEVMSKLQIQALEIMNKNDLSYEQMAQSAAIATAFLFNKVVTLHLKKGLRWQFIII